MRLRVKFQIALVSVVFGSAGFPLPSRATPAPLAQSVKKAIQDESTFQRIRIEDRFIYVGRKDFESSDLLMERLIRRLPAHLGRRAPILLVLDFNPGLQVIPEFNLVNQTVSDRIGNRSFSSLTPEEKSTLLYEPYFYRITDPTFQGIIHIDHHYPFPVLGDVSTTVLVGEFLTWVHTHHPGHPILGELQKGIGLVDHADPDITLAHLFMRHAQNRPWVESSSALLSSVALLNDHLRAPKGTALFQSQVQDLFSVALDHEDEVREGRSSFARVIQELPDSLLKPDPIRLARQRARSLLIHQRLSELAPKTMSRSGPILVVTIPDAEPISELSEILLFLIQENSPLLTGARVVVASLPNSKTGSRFLKVRSLDGTDLNDLYPLLRAQGLDAGGRASAGAAAYGKSGKSMLPAFSPEFKQDLDTFLQVCSRFLDAHSGSHCNWLATSKD